VDVTSAETEVLAAAANAQTAPRLTSSSTVDEGRFLPGVVLAGRYRIAGLLGRGGMGEVYRATDLTLGQAVALKFLPDAAAADERALARFFNEVRMARQVTHPNVCRVYDIGEIEGLRYISMEYVDGEDLSVLLRRIGRLPADKAIEIARKLCAGLAAAHEKGVLHRDLKPANIMIDGRGQVVIMDFGLAGLGEQLQGDVRSGTPAYMAPEQLAGTEVTARSDIYALGLVLYELFTGRRAFEAASLMELIEMQQRGTLASITSVVRDLDPTVERAIQRCLDPDPRRRPGSALAVAAALPGGDPLAEALAAGETPSPDLVAAAGETEGLRTVVAVSALAASIVAIVAVAVLGAQWSLLSRVQLDLPPEALERDARVLLNDAGYTAKPGDAVGGFEVAPQYGAWLGRHSDVAAARWKNPAAGYPPLINYWYREGVSDLVPSAQTNTVTNWSDPPFDRTGMLRLKMGADGRLLQLEAVPPQLERVKPATAAPFDWPKLFRAAGLDFAKFVAADPQWIPLAGWDERLAWTGPSPGTPSFPIRVEAEAWRGKPVYFRVVGPWSRPDRDTPPSRSSEQLFEMAIIYLALVSSGVVAWHNVRLGRGDRHGARILFLLYFVSFAGARLLWARHVPGVDELDIFWAAVMSAGLNGGVAWLFYLALEPWVRRGWPQTMITWSRFTTKGIRDVLVGRDLLYGTGIGAVIALIVFAKFKLHGAAAPAIPLLGALRGVRWTIGEVIHLFENSLFDVLMYTFILFVVRLVLRKEWLVAAVFIALAGAINSFGTSFPAVDWPANLLVAAVFTAVMLRLGLLAAIVSYAAYTILFNMPLTLDFSSWYAGLGMIPVALLIAVTWYGFRLSLGGRKVLRSELL
jgi:serine/threonine-protein kinase